ncbi:MAG TPA: hypothetical protein VFG08_04335, partial [Candidatus Polarisedimenticolia bacterium]|nr:hypothetical protein [Candidatus Polarisedimenticolia bacterium]
MSALFDRKGGGSRRPPARGAGSRRRARPSFDDDSDADEFDESEESEELEEDEARPAGRRRPAAGGKRPSA